MYVVPLQLRREPGMESAKYSVPGHSGKGTPGGPGPWLMERLLPWALLKALCSVQPDTVTHTALVEGLQYSQEGKLHIFKYSKKQLKAIFKWQMKDTESKG